jgi:hypothetical protein
MAMIKLNDIIGNFLKSEGNQIKEDDVSGTCIMNDKIVNAYRIIVEKI